MPEPGDTCQGELLTGSGTSPSQRSVLQSTKLKGIGDLKSPLTSDIEMLSLEFAGFQCGFGLVFPHGAPFPICWNGNVYPLLLYVGSR